MTIIGLFGTAAHVFMERAYRVADVRFIVLAWIGAAIIVAGTTYTTRHEIRAAPEHPPFGGAPRVGAHHIERRVSPRARHAELDLAHRRV